MARQTTHFLVLDLVDTFARAMHAGDAATLRRVFHPDAQIMGRFDGALEWSGVEAFIAACEEGRSPDAGNTPPHDVHGIDVAGDTAVVRVVTVWGGLSFFDTLSLIRHEGRWQIVARMFTYLG